MDYQRLIELFRQNNNGKYDDFNNKIINSGVKTIGCTIPFVRSVAKKYFQDVDAAMALPTHEFYEVDLLKGIAVSTCKLPFAEKQKYLTAFVDTIENWAVCDSSTVKVPKCERQQYFDYFCGLVRSDKVFVTRYGIVNLLSNYLDDNHIDAVFDVISQISLFGEYYVDMSVAWLLATAMAKCRNSTVKFMENEGRTVLNVFTYNKALQKMRDSYRISQDDKLWTKTLTRSK